MTASAYRAVKAAALGLAFAFAACGAAYSQDAAEEPKFEAPAKAKARAKKPAKQQAERDAGWAPPVPKATEEPVRGVARGYSRVPQADGGLPLPSGRGGRGATESAVGFDKNGNFNTGFKF
jgi:hypothetical protein